MKPQTSRRGLPALCPGGIVGAHTAGRCPRCPVNCPRRRDCKGSKDMSQRGKRFSNQSNRDFGGEQSAIYLHFQHLGLECVDDSGDLREAGDRLVCSVLVTCNVAAAVIGWGCRWLEVGHQSIPDLGQKPTDSQSSWLNPADCLVHSTSPMQWVPGLTTQEHGGSLGTYCVHTFNVQAEMIPVGCTTRDHVASQISNKTWPIASLLRRETGDSSEPGAAIVLWSTQSDALGPGQFLREDSCHQACWTSNCYDHGALWPCEDGVLHPANIWTWVGKIAAL